jgi:hypothetical protein
MRNLCGSKSLKYFDRGAALYWGGQGASCRMSASGHMLSMVPCSGRDCCCCCGCCGGGCCNEGSCVGGSCSCWQMTSIACYNTCLTLFYSISCCMVWALFIITLRLAICSCTSLVHPLWQRRVSSSSMTTLISSWCWSSWALTSWSGPWLWCVYCYDDEGGRSAAAVLVENTFIWVDGCPDGPLGLLASAVVAWDSVDVCGWLVWGMWVVRMMTSTIVRS